MVGHIPATRDKELTDKVNSMWEALVKENHLIELDWRRLLKELEDLEKTSPGMILLQSVMWAFKQNNANVDRALNRYVGFYGKDIHWYMCRASIGPLLGRTSMVTDIIDNCYPASSINGLITVMNAAAQTGMFISAKRAYQDLVGLGVDNIEERSYIRLPITLAAADYMIEHGIDERAVADRIQVAHAIAKQHARTNTFSVLANEFGVTIEYLIDAEIEQLVDINLDISEALCSKFEDTLSEHISLGVTQANVKE